MRTLTVFFIAMAILIGPSLVGAAEGEREGQASGRAALREQMGELNEKIGKLQRSLLKERPELAEFQQQIRELQKQLSEKMAAASPELRELLKQRQALWSKLRPEGARNICARFRGVNPPLLRYFSIFDDLSSHSSV